MKITVFGGTNNKKYSEEEIAKCEKLGKFLAERGDEILTGACGGFPYYVGRASASIGGKVIGYTPAHNFEEHVEKYKFPTDGVSDLVYTTEDFVSITESFLKRSWDMTPFSDIVIGLGGSWGTYFELMLSFYYKKTIVVVEEFAGAGEMFMSAKEYFQNRDFNPDVNNGATVISVKTLDDCIEFLKNYKK
ncbi:MAG: hypothetical protein LBM01_02095 [Christensenellaceae bacterium]|jgi:predicted Rossmann-fold nucleotide-binding protein|nr:hypothetical protein [Christensenellaceae bacterium]